MGLFNKKERDAASIRSEIRALQIELESLDGSTDGGSVGRKQDIAKVSESEQLSHSHAEALFATLSHELRTPLNGVLGMAQLLKEELESPKLETLESCAQHMQSVLHTLVNLAKIQNQWGHLPEYKEWINVRDFLEQLKKRIANRALTRHLSIKLRHADDRVRLRCDYDHLTHIVETAILGSLECTDIDAAGENVETLQVAWEVVGEDVTIVIENPLEVMPLRRGWKIYEVTESTKADAPERIRMEYLYWAVSNSILQHYDGAMIATKISDGRGVRTTLAFKMESMKASPSDQVPIGGLSLATPSRANAGVEALHFCMRILVVEDDPVNQELMSLLLGKVGQNSELAKNGQEAIEMLAEGHPYDLILMDIDMPVLNGLLATRAIRIGEAGEQAMNVPIVAVTAFNTLSDQSKFRKAGMNYFLSKPVSLKDLRSILLDVSRGEKNASD